MACILLWSSAVNMNCLKEEGLSRMSWGYFLDTSKIAPNKMPGQSVGAVALIMIQVELLKRGVPKHWELDSYAESH